MTRFHHEINDSVGIYCINILQHIIQTVLNTCECSIHREFCRCLLKYRDISSYRTAFMQKPVESIGVGLAFLDILSSKIPLMLKKCVNNRTPEAKPKNSRIESSTSCSLFPKECRFRSVMASCISYSSQSSTSSGLVQLFITRSFCVFLATKGVVVSPKTRHNFSQSDHGKVK